MRAAVARCLHAVLPLRFVTRGVNNRLSRWAWGWAPDPDAPASVQAWWAKGGQGTNHPPPRIRARTQRP